MRTQEPFTQKVELNQILERLYEIRQKSITAANRNVMS